MCKGEGGTMNALLWTLFVLNIIGLFIRLGHCSGSHPRHETTTLGVDVTAFNTGLIITIWIGWALFNG